MRPYAEIERDARDEPPFSNSTSGEIWLQNWCETPCAHDAAFQRGESLEGCPLLLLAYSGKTPVEWLEQEDSQDYHCVEFQPQGGGGPEPPPGPIPGQGELFDPGPHQGVLMYRDVVDELRCEVSA